MIKKTKTVNGFIQVYEIKIDDKKFWTLPGINPSTEFIGTVNPVELYDKIMERVLEFAQVEGVEIDGIYIPTNSNIHSNRSDIQKVIESKNYSPKDIPTVRWTKARNPETGEGYSFSEVYMVWEKAA